MTKKYIITGGSQGIGRATAELLLREGHEVLVFARRLSVLEEMKAEVEAEGLKGLHIASLDLSDLEAVKDTFANLDFLEGGIDGLVSNAAYQKLEHAMHIDLADVDLMVRLNVMSPIATMQASFEALKLRKGSVVYVGSIADTRYDAGYSIYGGSKAFMNSFIKHASKDMGPDGVRINCVSPGATDTPMLADSLSKSPEGVLDAFLPTVPMGRLGESKEVAEAIVFALNGPSYLHGDDIRIHGGIY